MRFLLISILAIATMGMGPARPQIPDETEPAPPSAVEPYHERFRTLGQTFGAVFVARSVSFSFRNFSGSTVGMCQFSSNGKNKVQLSTSDWKNGSDTFREMLMFHELGHCLLGRGHKNTKHSSGRPESIMNSSLFNQNTYLANRDQYLKELFTAANRSLAVVSSQSKTQIFDDCIWGH